MVTVFCPFTTTGAGRLVVQTDELRLVVDCRVNPVTLVGQVKITLAPIGVIISCGGGLAGNEMLNTVPLPQLPPYCVVPYRVLLDKIKPFEAPPSLLPVKL